MKKFGRTKNISHILLLLAGILLVMSVQSGHAKDTDIYAASTKNNAYILLDVTGSMDYAVYEDSIDYGAMYTYYLSLGTIQDPNAATYINFKRDTIYLLSSSVNVAITTAAGKSHTFTGDTGANGTWTNAIDTHTMIDANGNLVSDGSGAARLTVDALGHVLLDGAILPGNSDILLTNPQNGSDTGFKGLMEAPGNYFSGYRYYTNATTKTVATTGTNPQVFLVKGNWANLQNVYNLTYISGGGAAWKTEPYVAGTQWNTSTVSNTPTLLPFAYPSAGNTTNYLINQTKVYTISQPAAASGVMQVKFDFFDVKTDDSVKVCNGAGANCTTYTNTNMPAGNWSASIPGSSLKITFTSNNNAATVGKGFTISQYRYTTGASGNYLIQSRLQIAKTALNTVLNDVYGKLYWGFATFSSNTGGASIPATTYLDNNTPVTQAAMTTAINATTPGGGTPLGAALQDVFVNGFYNKSAHIIDHGCNKNFILVLTDGFPSGDGPWTRISGVDFSVTNDGDGWTQDPSQYAPPAPADYYDSVAHYLYTHSFYNKSAIAAVDQADSSKNIRTVQMAFGVVHPLLMNAAAEGGGSYFTVFNTAQVVQAIEQAIAGMINAVSYTAPVASVDATNKIQNGSDLYFGLFLPEANQSWDGNLKKFRLGDAVQGENPMMVYGKTIGQPAIDANGNFLNTITDIWTGQVGGFGVTENGAGELLLNKVTQNFANGGTYATPASPSSPYWSRNIYTLNNASGAYSKTKFDQTILPTKLGLLTNTNAADILSRNKIVNFVHGYTYDANANGTPVAVKPWALGSIIHSRPVVIDYYNPLNLSILLKRYVVVGANDGMLHVFDDSPTGSNQGQEVAAFIPGDLLPKLQQLSSTPLVEMVDGGVTLYRKNKAPKYLIFGERRGGGNYWCLDITNNDPTLWSIKWEYSNPVIAQSWSEVQIASVPYSIDSLGNHLFQDVAIFTGGYDPLEDNYPEPFTDVNNTGNPYSTPIANQTLTAGHYPAPGATIWNPATQDVFDVNGTKNTFYDPFNPIADNYGRGIFVVDIDDPSQVVNLVNVIPTATQILPFQVTYSAAGSSLNSTTGVSQTRTDMKFSFPASPAVVVGAYNYTYRNAAGKVFEGTNTNTLKAIYGIDIYANLFKIRYDFEEQINQNGAPNSPPLWTWSVTKSIWSTTKIFSANPGSSSVSGAVGKGTDTLADQGRKAFYPPAISWGGAGSFFDKKNYSYPSTTFSGTSEIATLLFGTGDREHPSYTMVKNRLYSVYDDSSVTAIQKDAAGNIIGYPVVSTTGYGTKDGYKESDLMNLTCGELGSNSTVANKTPLLAFLTDDATYPVNATVSNLEDGLHENDAKGWYFVLADQGLCATQSGVMNNTASLSSADNHTGEAVDSQPVLYSGILYFTTYQPTSGNPCNPTGNGYAYSVDYTTGSAAFNSNLLNGSSEEITDRYLKYNNIYGIPSGFSIFTSGGQAGAMSMMGSQLVGPKGPGQFQIPSPGLGLELYYWREGNSQRN
jgi:type IV pilus assembly protein PilY1